MITLPFCIIYPCQPLFLSYIRHKGENFFLDVLKHFLILLSFSWHTTCIQGCYTIDVLIDKLSHLLPKKNVKLWCPVCISKLTLPPDLPWHFTAAVSKSAIQCSSICNKQWHFKTKLAEPYGKSILSSAYYWTIIISAHIQPTKFILTE